MFLLKEKYYPYSLWLIFIILTFWTLRKIGIERIEVVVIQDLANIIITITAIFVSFLWVWLTLLHQNEDNKNLNMLRQNGKYNLLLSYFKHALLISIFTIVYSIFISLWFYINIYTFSVFLLSTFLMIILNYRVIYFLFKVLED